jgi:hypothetical protein
MLVKHIKLHDFLNKALYHSVYKRSGALICVYKFLIRDGHYKFHITSWFYISFKFLEQRMYIIFTEHMYYNIVFINISG